MDALKKWNLTGLGQVDADPQIDFNGPGIVMESLGKPQDGVAGCLLNTGKGRGGGGEGGHDQKRSEMSRNGLKKKAWKFSASQAKIGPVVESCITIL